MRISDWRSDVCSSDLLIADTPDVGEARSLDIAAIADREAIAAEVRVHVVETAEAAVQEAALVAELVHDLAPGHDIRVAGPLDDAFARNRRKRRADCFETDRKSTRLNSSH